MEQPGKYTLHQARLRVMAAQEMPDSSFTLRSHPRLQKLERIKYPGRVIHADRALATLGGSAELAKKFSKPKGGEAAKDDGASVQLSLRFGLASSEPSATDGMHMAALTSESSASRGFLLCVTLDDSGSASDAAIAATYERSHSFDRIADFIFRRDAPSAASYIATPGIINGISPSIAQLEAMGPFKPPIPYRFSTVETAAPSPALFRNSDAKLMDSAEKQQLEFSSVRPKCHSIDPRSDATPTDPPVALDQLDLTTAECDIHAKLVEMFEHQPLHSYTPIRLQPIWTRRGICRSLSLNVGVYGLSPQFLRLLGSVSYRFLQGPFHNSYIRLGYDPRVAHPQNALEQSPAWNQPIPIRLSTALWNFLSELNPGVVARHVDNFVGNVNHGSNAEDVDGNGRNVGSDASSSGQKPWLQPSPEDALLSPPSFRCFAILLVQVRHPLLEEWKAQMRPLPAYDHINGWIASEALDGLRDVVEKALEGMLSPDESHRLNAINKDHGRAADGRKGRQYTGLRRNRRQEYGRIRIQELAALAPHAPVPVAVAADLAAAGESQSRQPSSSARKATGKKIRDSMVVSSKAALTNHDFDFESKSSQPSGVEIMSQLSSISNLAVIATQDSGSDYDVFSGSSSSSSSSDSSSMGSGSDGD